MTQPRFSLYVCWRKVYEAVEARKCAAGGRQAVNGHWMLDLVCPCGQPIALGLAVAYSRRGYVVFHELLPA
jgi:hypothetical protein